MFSWFKGTSGAAAPLAFNLEVDNQHVFATREPIIGKLTITALVDTPFEKLDIKLYGVSRTYGRRVVPQAPNARTVTTAHRFLELTQPDLDLCLPSDRIFRAGYVYQCSFEFAIPDHMLPATCRHVVDSLQTHQLHTSMPPSLGDQRFGEAKDYAPRTVSIKYRIVANAWKSKEVDGTREMDMLASCAKRIRFMSTSAIHALPAETYSQINTIKEKMPLRKLWWAKSAGELAVRSIHASPFRVREVHSDIWHNDLSGQVELELKFYPASDGAKPPRQIYIEGVLRTETISAVEPLRQLPSDDPWPGPETDRHAAPCIMLSSQEIGGIVWSNTGSCDECPSYEALPSKRHSRPSSSKSCYSARVSVSLNAAVGFSLVPTFHSCLVSRTYNVHLKLSTQLSTMGFDSTMRLKLPVHVTLESGDGQPSRDSAMMSGETLGADAAMRCDRDVGADERLMWEVIQVDGSLDSPPVYESSGP